MLTFPKLTSFNDNSEFSFDDLSIYTDTVNITINDEHNKYIKTALLPPIINQLKEEAIKRGRRLTTKMPFDQIRNMFTDDHNMALIYEKVAELYGNEEAGKFADSVVKSMSCGSTTVSLSTPTTPTKIIHMCKQPNCPVCNRYRSQKFIHYGHNILRILIMPKEDGAILLDRMMTFIELNDIKLIAVKTSPLQNDKCMLRLSGIDNTEKLTLDHPAYTRLKNELALLDKAYPFLIHVSRLSSTAKNKYTVEYITPDNQIFSLAELYVAKGEGKENDREKGTKRGYTLNLEMNCIEHLTLKEKEELERAEAGIVISRNGPSIHQVEINADEIDEKKSAAKNRIVIEYTRKTATYGLGSLEAKDLPTQEAVELAEKLAGKYVVTGTEEDYQDHLRHDPAILVEEIHQSLVEGDLIETNAKTFDTIKVDTTAEQKFRKCYSPLAPHFLHYLKGSKIVASIPGIKEEIERVINEAPNIKDIAEKFVDSIYILKE